MNQQDNQEIETYPETLHYFFRRDAQGDKREDVVVTITVVMDASEDAVSDFLRKSIAKELHEQVKADYIGKDALTGAPLQESYSLKELIGVSRGSRAVFSDEQIASLIEEVRDIAHRNNVNLASVITLIKGKGKGISNYKSDDCASALKTLNIIKDVISNAADKVTLDIFIQKVERRSEVEQTTAMASLSQLTLS